MKAKRFFSFFLLIFTLFFCSVAGTQNVVVLLADDVGTDMVGCYEQFYENHPTPGYENHTPCIDYLAETGMIFRNAWTNPSCSPTRAQILTGKPACRSGIGHIVDTGWPIYEGIGLQYFHDTIPSILRIGGYTSAAVGKWHLADVSQFPPGLGDPIHPLGGQILWFDLYAGCSQNLSNHNVWLKTFATSIQPGVDECVPPPQDYCQSRVLVYATVDTADDAIWLIETLPEPFFLYVAFNGVHTPVQGPSTSLTAASCLCGQIQGEVNCSFSGGDYTSHQVRCMVQWLDNEVGRILCVLEGGPNTPDNPTTIIFMGDNGTMGSAKVAPFPHEHHKGNLYDGGINIPFIVKSPFVAPELVGTVSNALVCSTDILATVAEIAGVPLPPDHYGQRDSVSFLPVLAGWNNTERDYSYAEKFPLNFIPDREGNPLGGNYLGESHQQTIRDSAGWKILRETTKMAGVVSVEDEFYFLPRDPHELHNLMPLVNAETEPFARAYWELRAEMDVRYPCLVH